jgi:TRAP-type C4-dicarboxylate transport system permease small subunit
MAFDAKQASRRLRRGAELVAAAMFAAMFGAFLIQIVTRYVLRSPAGWTLEFCTLAYVWIVFFASAFILQDRDHIAFDMLYQAAGRGRRRILALLQSLILTITLLIALPGALDYVTFMSREKTWILQIPFSLAFACFILFMVMVILRSALRICRLLGRGWQDELG